MRASRRNGLPASTVALGLLLLAACSDPGSRAGGGEGANASAGRTTAEASAQPDAAPPAPPADPPGSTEPSAELTHAYIPEPGSKCAFLERDPADRPKDFIPASHSSNIIFYQRPRGGPLWDDINPDGAQARLGPDELIVAARYDMPDLWIRPKDGPVTLEVGKRLTCY